MALADFKKELPRLRETTLCFLWRENSLLLAMKKRGFGEGRWNGVGGKPNPGESIEQATIRETQEEIGVTPLSMRKVAILDFYFPHVALEKDWNQRVVVFIASDWSGKPHESDEMKPQWFHVHTLPFEQMWPDDLIWLPLVLAGNFVEAEFAFGKEGEIEEHHVIRTLPLALQSKAF